MKTLLVLFLLSLSSTSFANLKSVDCTYKSGPDKYYKVAIVEYVRKQVIKSLWFAPNHDSHYEEQAYVDGCVKLIDTYLCFNPVVDINIEASFDGETLRVVGSGLEDTLYSCK